MSLEVKELSVAYGSTRALDRVSLKLEPGEMFFLLGPSGCGKSTLLRTVAGFIRQFEGDLLIDGQSLRGTPPHLRNFGMVFQNYALFPHLTVNGNVAFGLEARQVPPEQVSSRVASALEIVGLKGYEQRRPGELSGGQQQRVALARALVIRPRVLLLDEPLSNLDAKLRWEMREELRRIHAATKITTLYVTHDQKEAMSLADRMAILNAGRIDAIGAPRELYRRPPTYFSAQFCGEVNALKGKLGQNAATVTTDLAEIPLSMEARPKGLATGLAVTVFCRPESVQLVAGETPTLPAGFIGLSSAQVIARAFLGESTLYEVELPGKVRWRALRHEGASEGFAVNAQIKLAVDAQAWSVLAD